MALCNVCNSAAERLSHITLTWDPKAAVPTSENLPPTYYEDVIRKPLPEGAFQHLSRVTDLQRSALTCPLCNLIRASLALVDWIGDPVRQNREGQFIRDASSDSIFSDPSFFQYYSLSPIYLAPKQGSPFRDKAHKGGFYLRALEIIIPPVAYDPSHKYGWLESTIDVYSERGSFAEVSGAVSPVRPLTSSCSYEAFLLMGRWINTCIEEHEVCKKTVGGESLKEAAEFPLPTRVIDVGPRDGSKEPRLFESNGSSGNWVALSHCWGPPEHQPHRTTRQNIEQHHRAILMEQLPKTFINAIEIVRNLGLQYLWIDSLCIIQDDDEDWESEALKMGLIYERAIFTIAASQAYDSRFGCFFQRNPEKYFVMLNAPAPVQIPLSAITGEDLSTFTATLDSKLTVSWMDFEASPLHRRAWVTQEWILSRRMIHFFRNGIVWICNEISQNETGDDSECPRRNRKWINILEDYSKREITFAKDRLTALVGLAKEMQKARNDQYLLKFGVWTSELVESLLWYPYSVIQRNADIGPKPSWSWASTLGDLYFWDPYIIPGREGLIRVCSEIQVSDSGELLVHSRIIRLERFRILPRDFDPSTVPSYVVEDKEYFTEFFFNWPMDATDRHTDVFLAMKTSGKRLGVVVFDERPVCGWKEYLTTPTYCAPLTKEAGVEHTERYLYFALILQPLAGNPSAFKRVGLGRFVWSPWLESIAQIPFRIF